jgi:hypothetical protein
VVQPLLAIWDLLRESVVEALDDLSEEHARLAAGIEECGLPVAPKIRREDVKNPIRQLRRGEDFVAT